MSEPTPTNGHAPRDAARRVVFATDDPPPATPADLPRAPRDGEAFGDYLTAVARTLGVLPGDASLTAARKRQVAEEMIGRASEDALFGGSRMGKALLAADHLWQQRNPQIAAELGRLSDRSRDLLGRGVRGPARAVALTLERLTEDPDAPLTAAEAELLASLAPAVIEAREQAEQAAAEHRERILSAVNAAQVTYPAGSPGPAVVREQAP